MYQQKTLETDQSVEGFLDRIDNEEKRREAKEIVELCKSVTQETPKMWGESIVGFGTYAYRYASGHSGVSAKIGYSPRKSHHVLYLALWDPTVEILLSQLGDVKHGVGCLYIKRWRSIDQTILKEMIERSFALISTTIA